MQVRVSQKAQFARVSPKAQFAVDPVCSLVTCGVSLFKRLHFCVVMHALYTCMCNLSSSLAVTPSFSPCMCRCRGLLLLETYTTKEADDLELPPFLEVVREVTTEPQYSMLSLSDTRTEHITLS